ncbi:type I restriction-modification system subunit M [Orbus sasakiae]|uniref:site-specific DNA-methyltransferase (adenine-specific) n=1 Tax=Orbus sasakiae TaxID=1078475 RepID=A0ABP9N2Y0_9GAMM
MVEAQHKKELERQLWNIANTLRGNMSADEFRDYILGFIFYKYLSERMEQYADDLLKPDNLTYRQLTTDQQTILDDIKQESVDYLGYFLLPNELFEVLAEKGKNGEFILDDLGEVLRHIEQSTMGSASEDDFNGLFSDIDLTSNRLGKNPNERNQIISKVFEHLNEIQFLLDDTEIDVLGDAYEYLIGQFASGAGKKAGEFYTPPMVSKLLAKLVTAGKTRLRDVYDPTCGSGSLLLRVAKEVGVDNVGYFYGQEKNPSTYNLARMNMILHGVHYRSFDIQQDDTLERPAHSAKRMEAVVANPPFSANWSAAEQFKTDDRFSDYGKLAPSSKADFAFVQHMLSHLADDGTMAVVLPHGVLFRGAAEGHIRRYLLETKNWLDAVIGLPTNIFYGTSIPTCVLVFKKQRPQADNVLFIDASQHFTKASNQNYLQDDDVERIFNAYTARQNHDKYAYVASLNEIADNDYNLNIPRYVDTFEEEEQIDLNAVASQIQQLDKDMIDIDKTIADFCAELNIKAPF